MKKISALIILTTLLLAACGGTQAAHTVELQMAPESELPVELITAPVRVQEAYRFALVNQALLEQIPCYCGCGAAGHESNYDCYVAGVEQDGSVVFDFHAFG